MCKGCVQGNPSVYDGLKEVPPRQSRKSQGEEAGVKMRTGRMDGAWEKSH